MSERPRCLLIGGGMGQPVEVMASALEPTIRHVGLHLDVTNDIEAGMQHATQHEFALLVMAPLAWRMLDGRFDEMRAEWGYTSSLSVRRLLADWVHSGRPLLALRTAVLCFDDWPRWGELIGGRWEWDQSYQTPAGHLHVQPTGDHPIVAGLEGFELTDSCYCDLRVCSSVEVIATTSHDGSSQPGVWVQQAEGARVVCSVIGQAESLGNRSHAELLGRSCDWLLAGRDRIR